MQNWQSAEEMLGLAGTFNSEEFGALQMDARSASLRQNVDKILSRWARNALEGIHDFNQFCIYKGSVAALLSIEEALLGENQQKLLKAKG